MNREYVKWFSSSLQKNMEMLVFGHHGASVLFFPTRSGRFYDYENLGVINALRPKIEQGLIKIFCVDSIDSESFYNSGIHPSQKTFKHLRYEEYILEEVLPFIHKTCPNLLIIAGCSMGAFHAVNIAFRHPQLFNKVVGMSGRYDLTLKLDHYQDLLEGYIDEDIYYNMPAQYIPKLTDPLIIDKLKKLEIILAVGRTDVFYQSNVDLNFHLWLKDIKSQLHIWDHEAHSARYWRMMVNWYL